MPQRQIRRSEPDVAALSLCCGAAIASLIPVVLFQLDQIPRLPDPPLRMFDSEAITSSREAHPFGLPDAPLGLLSYAMTLALIATALPSHGEPRPSSSRSSPSRPRSSRPGPSRPILQRLLTAKLALDGALAVKNSVTQLTRFRRVCSYCMGTALATVAMLYCGRHLFLPSGPDAGARSEEDAGPAPANRQRFSRES